MRTVALGEVAEVVSGATPKSGVGEYWGGDVYWATPADLSKLERADISSTPRTLTRAGLKSCAARELPPGSVLLSSRAPIGHVAVNSVPMATNQGFKSLIPRPDCLEARYIYHWLRSHTAFLHGLGNGATFKELSKATVERIQVPLPSVEDQRRIAAILDQADAVRVGVRRVHDRLGDLGAAVFHELFGDPLLHDAGAPVRELAKWVVPGRPITYGILKPGPEVVDGVPYVRVADMKDRVIDVASLKRTSTSIAHEYRRSTLRAGDLLVSIRGHVGRFAVVPEELDGANITQDSARLALDPPSAAYVRAAMETASGQHWLARHTRGAAVRGINLGDLRRFPLRVPTPAELDRHAAAVDAIDQQRRATRRNTAAADQLFSSLQARAFRGEL